MIKNTATLIREIAKHTPELCQLIMNAGGVAAVVDYIGDTKGNVRLPGELPDQLFQQPTPFLRNYDARLRRCAF